MHELAPASEYFPAGHGIHAEALVLPVVFKKVPAGHFIGALT